MKLVFFKFVKRLNRFFLYKETSQFALVVYLCSLIKTKKCSCFATMSRTRVLILPCCPFYIHFKCKTFEHADQCIIPCREAIMQSMSSIMFVVFKYVILFSQHNIYNSVSLSVDFVICIIWKLTFI